MQRQQNWYRNENSRINVSLPVARSARDMVRSAFPPGNRTGTIQRKELNAHELLTYRCAISRVQEAVKFFSLVDGWIVSNNNSANPRFQFNIKLCTPDTFALSRFVDAISSLPHGQRDKLIWNSLSGTFTVDTDHDGAKYIVNVLAGDDSIRANVTDDINILEVEEIQNHD